MFKRAALSILLVAFAAPAAVAQMPCSQRDNFVQHLKGKFSETPVAMGLVSNGSVLEVLASTEGSWTIIVTSPNGTSCAVATGEAWQGIEAVIDKLKKGGPLT